MRRIVFLPAEHGIMNKWLRFSVYCFLLCLLSGVFAQEKIHYTITIPNPELKKFRVLIKVQGATQDRLKFVIPAWCPGFYLLLNYERDISEVRALDSKGLSLKVEKEGDRSWVVSAPDKTETTLEYEVAARDGGFGFFRCAMSEKNAFVSGPAAFMYLDGHKEKPTELRVFVPEGWKIATGMQKTDAPNVFTAKNYDEFIDSPVELGDLWMGEFKVGEVLFEVSIAGNLSEERRGRWMEQMKKVSETSIALMGSAPFKRYVYIIHVGGGGSFFGGLEHLYSTVLSMFPGAPSLAGLAAHELFHTWNVKHIRPFVLGPFDYTGPVRTKNLWFAEGVTEYYAKLIVARSGLHGETELLRELSGEISGLQNNPARLRVTLADSSYKVWEANNSIGYGGLNYYNKGCVVGLLLDLKIREVTKNKKSLDDVMRLMMTRYGLPKPGYAEDGILKACSEVAGTDLTEFYNRLVESIEELPYDEVLAAAGLMLEKGERRWTLKRAENPTPEQLVILEGWLKGKTN
ncbi:MAG: M61 family metallopeptidase [Fimbriimonadia bacterium]|nr:M61 family metallopeptidase [Fimbriimonadia bacterium]